MHYGKSPAAQAFFRTTKGGFRVTRNRPNYKLYQSWCLFPVSKLVPQQRAWNLTLINTQLPCWSKTDISERLVSFPRDRPSAMKQFLYYSCLGTSACHVTSKQRQKSLWVTRDQPALHLAREHVRCASITRSGPFLKTANTKNKHLKWDGLPVQRSQLLKANYR